MRCFRRYSEPKEHELCSSRLSVRKKEYYVVDHSDLGKFINEYYSFKGDSEYDFVSDEEANNDNSYEFVADGEVGEYDETELEAVLNGERHSFMTGTFLNDLARKNVISKGNYLITVCW